MKMQTYQDKLFDTSYVHQINIQMDPTNFNDLKQNPLSRTKYHADIVIDGDEFKDVCISTKGALSLRTCIISKSQRYSLNIRFNKYNTKQTYYGLDNLDLNNSSSDPTMIKDAIIYYMFHKMNVPAPLISFTNIYINNEMYGFFLAIEELDQSFLKRNFNGHGHLYEPEATQVTLENNKITSKLEEAIQNNTLNQFEDTSLSLIYDLNPYSAGADLIYTNDNIDNYPEIFNNSPTSSTLEDKKRLIQSLKLLSNNNLSGIDTDEVIRYFVVHNFTNNFDSYTGSINHNYTLYENEGKLSMVPWDYDFYNVLVTDEKAKTLPIKPIYTIDSDIDKPLYFPLESRPMWSWIVNNSKYLNQYHQIYKQFIENYLLSNDVENEINRINEILRNSIQKDTTQIIKIEEYDELVNDIQKFIKQRSESIYNQLSMKYCA